ncbi:Centromere/kinetochore protein zw10-like [Stylophora pistillata]|uniref:Centromere/kinetochore protein zw10-like n=1 Tax=Stylophora pistillata TaxID=50429 RepID=A0A2B4SPQ9_STYPI|nr:Centromere/kinetochore protein zw10-like [Stylophora pistillata]
MADEEEKENVTASATHKKPKHCASLVTDVLLKSGRLEKEDINSCVKKTLQKAEEVKAEVLQAIYKEYTFDEFLDFSNSTFEMNWNVNNLLTEIQNVSGRLKSTVEGSLDAAAREHGDLVKHLRETEAIAELLKRLHKIHEALDAFPGELSKAAYYNAAKLVQSVKELLSDLPKAGQEGRIFIALREEWERQKAQLTATLERVWTKSIAWTTPTTASLDNRQGHLKTQLKLDPTGCSMSTVLQAMEVLGILEKRLRAFGKRLVQFIFRPIILFPSLKPQVDKTKQETTTVSFAKESGKKIIDPTLLYSKFSEILVVLRNFFDGSRKEDEEKSKELNVSSSLLFAKLARRSSYSMAFKIKVIAEAEAVENNSEIAREYGLSESMVRRWRRDQATILSGELKMSAKRATMGRFTPKYPELDQQVMEWFSQQREQGIAVSGLILRLKAKELSDDPAFKASRGWYEKWKRRHSVSMRTKTTLAQRLPADLEENIVCFHRFVIAARRRADYPLSRIYNMDETPMRFELPSNRTLEFSGSRTVPVKSCGAEKRSFTVVLAVAADGAKVPPKVIFKGVREYVWPDLSETIIAECLKKSVPTTSAQLEKYQDVIKTTEEFEINLVSLGLVPKGTNNLTSYAKDVGIHFGNKKCQDLLVRARDLMKDDIHNTVLVDSNKDKGVLLSLGDIQKALSDNKKGVKHEPLQRDPTNTLSKFTFCLPSCRISESTEKLMNLAYKTLIEATQSTPQCAIQLFYSVRNMFELYCNVVPTYHQKHLILHILTNLGKVWNGILPVDIYCQSLGALFDDVLKNIAWEVIQLEDISTEEAHQLHSLLSILVERGSEIFQNTEEEASEAVENSWNLCTVVPHWIRYKELIAILEASLQDIVDRWADGKGPLAHEFTAQEVKGLIRALFQNTDRRAAALDKIKPVQA